MYCDLITINDVIFVLLVYYYPILRLNKWNLLYLFDEFCDVIIIDDDYVHYIH